MGAGKMMTEMDASIPNRDLCESPDDPGGNHQEMALMCNQPIFAVAWHSRHPSSAMRLCIECLKVYRAQKRVDCFRVV